MNFFNMFLILSICLCLTMSINGQSTDNKTSVFESTSISLLNNAMISSLVNIRSIAQGPCKSSGPSKLFSLKILNMASRRIKAVWYDYNGLATQIITWSNSGEILSVSTYTNHCFALYLDADNLNGEIVYFKIPDINSTYYAGDLSILKQQLHNSSWLSNPDLKTNHVEAYKKLVDYVPVKQNTADLVLIRSSYYDDSADTKAIVQSFFNSFNETNKFIDPFFNPLNKLSNQTAKRISEYRVVSSTKPYKPSVFLGSSFGFRVINDLSVDLNVYWIDYSGKPNKYGIVQKGQAQVYGSYLGNVWVLSNQQTCYVIDLGKTPFNTTNCNVSVSQITNVALNYNIANETETFTGSIILNSTDLEEYNSRQGQLGNCWFLQCMVSLYARYPEQIVSKFINPDLMPKTGAVAIKLWSALNKNWRLVILDDYLAYSNSSKWFASSASGPLENRFWVPLLEKAFAKQVQSISNLNAGASSISSAAVYEMILGPSMNKSYYMSVPLSDKNNYVFEEFLKFYKNGSVISFSSRPKETNIQTCMVDYHGYGLLDVKENVANSGFTLVKIHNTWSNGGEWCQDWGDSSPLWDQYPLVKAELKFEKKNDGTFWVEKKDFSKAFSVLWIAGVVQK